MLNLPQPRLPTPTVFDGTSPTFPEWARELRAYLNISQFEHINLFDFAYDAEEPLTTDIMVLQTEAGARQGAELLRLRNRIQELQAERDLPQAERREHAVIDGRDTTSQQPTSMHNKYFRMLQLQQYVEQENSSATSSCMLQNQVANQTTYFDDFSGPTSDGKCFDNSDINMLQELVYNSTPYYRA